MLNALIANKFPGIVITKIYVIERTVDSEQAYWIDFERVVLKPPPLIFQAAFRVLMQNVIYTPSVTRDK